MRTMRRDSWVGVLLVLLVLVSLGCAGQNETSYPRLPLPTTRFSLTNGLDVVLHPDPAFRFVSVDLRYDAGARHDPAGNSGLARLVEQLMFRSKVGASGAFTTLTRTAWKRIDAQTNQDGTSYYETIAAEDLPTALFVEAARMARPLDGVDASTFAAELDNVRRQRVERIDGVPYGNFIAIACRYLFDGGPYGRPAEGLLEELDRLSLADAKRFVDAYYRPNNATLVIAGGFDPRSTTELVHRLFDAIPAARLPSAGTVSLARSSTNERHIVPTNAVAPAVIVAWVVPAAGREHGHAVAIARDVLRQELARRLGGRAARVQVEIEHREVGSVFFAFVELARDGSVNSTIETIDRVVDDLAESRIPREPIGDTKRRGIDRFTLEFEMPESRAMMIQEFLTLYDRADGTELYLKELATLRRDDIATAADIHLRKGRRVSLETRLDARAPKAGAWPGWVPL